MNSTQQQTEPLPHRRRWKTAALGGIVAISTLIAVIWALSDTGRIDEHWSKLALIFFTWLVVIMTAIALYRAKE